MDAEGGVGAAIERILRRGPSPAGWAAGVSRRPWPGAPAPGPGHPPEG
jgi:hypothetical protein